MVYRADQGVQDSRDCAAITGYRDDEVPAAPLEMAEISGYKVSLELVVFL